ncbi:trypsin-like serine peptidase [Spirosoma koreense]
MEWNTDLTTLNYRLARLYRRENDAIRVCEQANLNTIQIDTDGTPVVMWFNILDYARQATTWKRIIALLEVVTGPNELGADDETLQGILENFRKGQFSVQAPKPSSSMVAPPEEEKRLEKLMGAKTTLLPISFLQRGLDHAQAVVRIVGPDGLGTGFLIANNYIVTNNHVIKSKQAASQSIVQFNYQKTTQDLDAPYEEFLLTPDAGFLTCTDRAETADLDFTIVKVQGDPNTKYGALLFGTTPVQKDDFVNIIQHPAGGPKQIALYHNIVTGVGDRVIQYLTDTLPGSSGSPVFNSAWEVVALHHAGGTLTDPESSQPVFRNEGITGLRIKEIVDGL